MYDGILCIRLIWPKTNHTDLRCQKLHQRRQHAISTPQLRWRLLVRHRPWRLHHTVLASVGRTNCRGGRTNCRGGRANGGAGGRRHVVGAVRVRHIEHADGCGALLENGRTNILIDVFQYTKWLCWNVQCIYLQHVGIQQFPDRWWCSVVARRIPIGVRHVLDTTTTSVCVCVDVLMFLLTADGWSVGIYVTHNLRFACIPVYKLTHSTCHVCVWGGSLQNLFNQCTHKLELSAWWWWWWSACEVMLCAILFAGM